MLERYTCYQRALTTRALLILETPENGESISTADISKKVLDLERANPGFDFAYWAGGTLSEILQSSIQLRYLRVDWEHCSTNHPIDWLNVPVVRGDRSLEYLGIIKRETEDALHLLGYSK